MLAVDSCNVIIEVSDRTSSHIISVFVHYFLNGCDGGCESCSSRIVWRPVGAAHGCKAISEQVGCQRNEVRITCRLNGRKAVFAFLVDAAILYMHDKAKCAPLRDEPSGLCNSVWTRVFDPELTCDDIVALIFERYRARIGNHSRDLGKT